MARLLIDGLVIDGELRGVPALDSETTKFPVEEGADLTDHVRQLPRTFEVEGIVTDTPIGDMVTIRSQQQQPQIGPALSPDAQRPSAIASAHFERIWTLKRAVVVQTTRRLYERMVMIGYTDPYDATTGKAVRFTARFEQITTVKNDRSVVRTTPRNQGVGKGGAKPADNKESNRIIVVTLRKRIETPTQLGGSGVVPTGLASYLSPNGAGGPLSEEPILKNGLTHHFRARTGDKADGYVELGTARTPGIPYGGGKYTPFGMEIAMPANSKDSIQQNADAHRNVVQANEKNDKLWKELQGKKGHF
jgi:hypothetical protein